MANTAFNHSPTLQVPGSTTTNGLVTWDANDGGGFLSSSVVLSTGGALSTLTSLVVDTITIDGTSITTTASNNPINLTPHGTGAVVITKTSTPTILLTNGTNSNAITLNTGTTAANYTITLPAALPGAAGKVLQSSGGSPHSVLEWATPSGGPSITGTTSGNQIMTANSAIELNGEADLTFDGGTLLFGGSGENTIKVTTSTGTAPANIQIAGAQGGTGNGGANLILGEGDLDGTAGDRAYRFSYLSNSDYFRFGSVQSGDIFRVADGATKVDFLDQISVGSATNNRFGFWTKNTQEVSTSLAYIITAADGVTAQGGLIFVAGRESSGSTKKFYDLLMHNYRDTSSSPTVISSTDANGASGRTYDQNQSGLRLRMASGTYDVAVWVLSAPNVE